MIEAAAFSKTTEAWGTPITFGKLGDHTYELKDAKDGVSLNTGTILAYEKKMKITATQAVTGVVIVVKRKGYTEIVNSDEIEFTRQAGDRFTFAKRSANQQFNTNGNTFTQEPTINDEVADDKRDFEYSIIPSGSGATIDPRTGEVSITLAAVGTAFTITATKAQNDKYKEQTAQYTLKVLSTPVIL